MGGQPASLPSTGGVLACATPRVVDHQALAPDVVTREEAMPGLVDFMLLFPETITEILKTHVANKQGHCVECSGHRHKTTHPCLLVLNAEEAERKRENRGNAR